MYILLLPIDSQANKSDDNQNTTNGATYDTACNYSKYSSHPPWFSSFLDILIKKGFVVPQIMKTHVGIFYSAKTLIEIKMLPVELLWELVSDIIAAGEEKMEFHGKINSSAPSSELYSLALLPW